MKDEGGAIEAFSSSFGFPISSFYSLHVDARHKVAFLVEGGRVTVAR